MPRPAVIQFNSRGRIARTVPSAHSERTPPELRTGGRDEENAPDFTQRIDQAKADWKQVRFDSAPGDNEFIPLPEPEPGVVVPRSRIIPDR
jgi:hypothetical protein